MFQRRILSRSALVVGALFCLLVPSSAVAAGAPASVTVRVEGLTETKVLPTLVTTTAAPVIKDGNSADSCPGTSAAGALELATKGAWSGKWFSGLGYSVETIESESYPFTQPYFWTFWLNHKSQEVGVCGVELESGDEVLLFPECFSEKVGECPAVAPTPLAIEAPATANVGENVTVTVKQYNSKGEASPAVGASVGGGGAGASTDSQGHATLKFFGDATDTLKVSGAPEGPPAIRTETTICVHEGNDGTCGTTLPPHSGPAQVPGSSLPPTPETSQRALVADASGVLDGHVYSRRHAPRVLAGKVISTNAFTSISIRLRRPYRGRCWVFNGALERLQRVRCGRGGFFKLSSAGPSFSYLLPSKLPPGRYVFEIEASDAAGDHTSLHRGSSKVVFYVK
jgi:hypothetical protein